jgi:effector-binding domain-containing protein
MIPSPKIEYRPEQHYAAIQAQVPIPFGSHIPPLNREVTAWLAKKGIKPSGPSIIRYLTTDMSKKLDIEVGWLVASAVPGDERVITGVIPAGRYAVLTYTGSYRGKGIYNATVALLEWAERNRITWRKNIIDGAEWWVSRNEFYLTDPKVEPDPKKWQTELAFMVED